MIVLTLTRPWLLVGYRALGRKWASSGLVSSIGEAVTQAPAGAAFVWPDATLADRGRADGRGANRRTRGGPEGPPHTRHRSQVAGEARLSGYLTCLPSTHSRRSVKTMYRSPASSKQTAPRTSSQIRCSRVVTVML